MFKSNEIIRQARISRGYTQLDLARWLGYKSPQFVSNCERGVALFPTEAYRVLCRRLGVRIAPLIEANIKDYGMLLKKRFKQHAK